MGSISADRTGPRGSRRCESCDVSRAEKFRASELSCDEPDSALAQSGSGGARVREGE
jgi:hypothetical protein